MSKHTPLVFVILDGWGYNPNPEHNAIAQAHTPNWDALLKTASHRLISGSGVDVGLPAGQMGNSEVGHMHVGAGRIIYQDLTRINKAIEQHQFEHNPTLHRALHDACDQGKAVHVMGLLSPGGVHSHEKHLHALIKMAAHEKVTQLYIHAFLDGRDCPPRSAEASIAALEKVCAQAKCGKIISLCGRYYAMDRDQRWQRTEKAYRCVALAECAFQADTALKGLAQAYARDENDEFVQPTSIGHDHPAIAAGDVVIFMNFRADRARQISYAFVQNDFQGFDRGKKIPLAHFVSLTEYAANMGVEVAFAPQNLKNVFGEVLAKEGLTQFRIAETEKYAHVTFFLNGGREEPFPGESRELIPSPKNVATYDLKPEMSAYEVTDVMVDAIKAGKHDVIMTNFANPDMVGHTGNFAATVKAIEVMDTCLGKIMTAIKSAGGELIVTSDHGNAEFMFDPQTQQPHTAHTNLPVPLVYLGRKATFDNKPANLADLAPTMLSLLGLPIPKEMTGRMLLTLEK